MDFLFQFFSKLCKAFKALTPSKKLSIIIVAAVSLISIGIFVNFVNQDEYRVLFSNLSAEDTENIIARLKEKGIFYKVGPAGDSILVSSERVSELRLDLASLGLPQGGGVGFEIFDKKNFGATEFVQRLNYQRALQGELSRTINSLDEVQSSRVHIVMPKKSLFANEQDKPTASVIIKLKPSRRLQASQVEGMAHLVARSVEGLQPEEVAILDSRGNILSKVKSESKSSKMTDSQREYQKSIEEDLANKIRTILERVVGRGNAVARVSVNLDFTSIEKTEEVYDSEEPVPRSLHRKTKISYAPIKAGESTVSPIKKETNDSYNTEQEEKDETINYEINRVVSKTVMPVGKINRLSVAVLVDGIYHKDDKGLEEFQPRSKKEMKSLEDIVKNSAGFNASRGDQIVVTSIPFKKIEFEAGSNEGSSWENKLIFLMPLMKYFISLVALIFVVFFILRPLVKLLLKWGGDQEVVTPELPLDNSHMLLGPGRAMDRGLNEVEVVKKLANHDAQQFAELLRNWLK
ncbi:MAG: flagellar M-ring protein FliF [Deltaproteobacteria bacterium]|nr:flagellar M-ring protein FliF [Deltaproteobacteria bacterium]